MDKEKVVVEEGKEVEAEIETKEEEKVDEPNVEKKYTDKDINEIVDRKFARWQEKKEKEINEAKKLADMNAQEKAEFERDRLQSEIEELRRAKAVNEMSGTARTMLREENVDVTDDLLALLVSDDADETKANVESFNTMFKTAVDKAVLDRVKNPNDKRGTTSTVTKDEIMNIKDRRLRQEAIKENMHLFN